MYATLASDPGSHAPNEDWAGYLPGAVTVLDGVTVRAGTDTGCRHGTPWYVRQLGARLLRDTSWPLTRVLAAAITEVAAEHRGWCDLTAIGAPSAAAAILRAHGGQLEWLVLADITIILDTATGIQVITDNRVAASTAGLTAATPALGDRIREARETSRNQPGGYWVAAADPAAADRALTGSVPLTDVRRVLVTTDGAARAVDLFKVMTWEQALDAGPAEMIRAVRQFEDKDPECMRWPRMKPADDATAVAWVP